METRSASSPSTLPNIGRKDASISREIMRRLDLAGQELPSSLEAFVELYCGSNRQLMLRLACTLEHKVP
jgi:hypothetical protein